MHVCRRPAPYSVLAEVAGETGAEAGVTAARYGHQQGRPGAAGRGRRLAGTGGRRGGRPRSDGAARTPGNGPGHSASPGKWGAVSPAALTPGVTASSLRGSRRARPPALLSSAGQRGRGRDTLQTGAAARQRSVPHDIAPPRRDL